MTLNKIIVGGFMGSGKSSVAGKLNNLYGYSFTDLDQEIERKEGKKISDIFIEDGESHFRQIENNLLSDLLDGESEVIALGGGTLSNSFLLDLVLSYKNCFYLKTPFQTLWKRIGNSERPLVKQGYDQTLTTFNSREKFYDLLHYTVLTDGMSINEVAEEIKWNIDNG